MPETRQIETPLNAAARRYMAESMAMTEPYDDQEQNWILGHLVTFASAWAVRSKPVTERHRECARCLASYPYETKGLSPCCDALLVSVTEDPV